MTIIDNYADLPVGKYLDILAANERDADDLDKQVATIAILADATEDDVLALPLDEYATLAQKAAFLTGEDKGSHAVAKSYRLGGLELIPVADAAKVTAGQFIDFQQLTRDDGMERNLPAVLSCLLVPKGRTYGTGYDIADVQDAIRRHLSVTDALSLLAFFFASSEALLRRSLTYSEKEAKRVKDPAKKAAIQERIKAARAMLSPTAGAGSPQ